MKLSLIFIASCFILGQNIFSTEAAVEHASHNVTWGVRGLRERLLYREVASKKAGWLSKAKGDLTWEQKNIPNPKMITRVVVTDQYVNGNGGYATLAAGGPQQHFVKIHFTSQRFRGYNFIVEIYGE